MLKNALKNFFVNLKYVFTPLGVMFLGAFGTVERRDGATE